MRTLIPVMALVGLACAASQPNPAPVAPAPGARYIEPTDQTVIAENTPSFDREQIFVINNSSATIVVTSIRLRDCQNIASPCTLIPLNIAIGSGNRRQIYAVRPADSERAYSYRYSWTWTGRPRAQ